MTVLRQRFSWEECIDDGGNSFAFAAEGHVPSPTPKSAYLALARAVSYAVGREGVMEYVRAARFNTGFSGEHPRHCDLIACEEDGESSEYDDDDELIYCTDVRPTTWATMPCDPPAHTRTTTEANDHV